MKEITEASASVGLLLATALLFQVIHVTIAQEQVSGWAKLRKNWRSELAESGLWNNSVEEKNPTTFYSLARFAR